MNDDIQVEEELSPKPKAKRPPKRDKIGGKVEGSRVGYADRNKISVDGLDENFKHRIVNHDSNKFSGRVAELQKIGYKIVNDSDLVIGDDQGVQASTIGSNVGKHVGNGTRGILMRIPKKYYEEDKAAKQAQVDAIEEGMVARGLEDASGIEGEVKVSTNDRARVRTTVHK